MKPVLFSFIGDEFENVFHYSDLFLPGIEKIVGVYYCRKTKQLKILARKREQIIEEGFEEVIQHREKVIMIQKFRTVPQPFSWIKKDDLPFDLHENEKHIAPTLFTEFENVVLVLRFPNDADQLNDLLIIYFNQHLGNFGLNKSDKILSADNKTIIGHLLYHQFKSFLQINQLNKELLRTMNNVVRSVIQDNNSMKDQLNQIQASYGENLVNMARQLIFDLSKEFDTGIALSDEAIEKIRGYRGNIKHLQVILKNAVIFTGNLLNNDEQDIIVIHPYSLDFDSYQVVEKTEQMTRKIDSRHSRAMQLLDKLERAASMLKSKNLPLISSRVGQSLEPPVSAPAITDALRKNRDMIRQILEKYPEKWEIIRKDFKPLLNQLRQDGPDVAEVESA